MYGSVANMTAMSECTYARVCGGRAGHRIRARAESSHFRRGHAPGPPCWAAPRLRQQLGHAQLDAHVELVPAHEHRPVPVPAGAAPPLSPPASGLRAPVRG